MRTATIREAQHHLSKLVNEVRESGQEIILTRRGEEVCKITPIVSVEEREVDWERWLEKQKEFLKKMPFVGGSLVLEERENSRW